MARGRTDALVDAAAVLAALTLAGAAGVGGFVLGRATGEGGTTAPAATEEAGGAETATTGETGAIGETGATGDTGATDTGATDTGEAGGDETVTAGTGEGAETAEVETEAGEATEGDAEAGASVFAKAGCGNCHTLEQANATGQVGPNLNETDLDEEEIRETVENGRGGMPAFKGQLEDDEIENVAAFVAASKRG